MDEEDGSPTSYRRGCIGVNHVKVMTWVYYQDKCTKQIAHMLDFQKHGVTKKWVIITEISREVENWCKKYWKTWCVPLGVRVGDAATCAADGGVGGSQS